MAGGNTGTIEISEVSRGSDRKLNAIRIVADLVTKVVKGAPTGSDPAGTLSRIFEERKTKRKEKQKIVADLQEKCAQDLDYIPSDEELGKALQALDTLAGIPVFLERGVDENSREYFLNVLETPF